MSEPYGLTLAQIGQLDRWQIIGIYFAARDKQGTVQGSGKASAVAVNPEAAFRDFWKLRNLPEHRIDEVWQRLRAEQQQRTRKAQEQAQARKAQRPVRRAR